MFHILALGDSFTHGTKFEIYFTNIRSYARRIQER
jgi:hypothetical protein